MPPALRSVLDFHTKERPRLSSPMSPDSQHDLVKAINSRLTDTPESIIWVGQTLTTMFGNHLPKSTWSEWGIDLSYQEASDIRSLSQCPLILDNLDKLPPSRSTLMAAWTDLEGVCLGCRASVGIEKANGCRTPPGN